METADFMDVFEPFCYALLVKWFVMEFIEIFVRVGMYGSCGGFGRCFGVGPRMFPPRQLRVRRHVICLSCPSCCSCRLNCPFVSWCCLLLSIVEISLASHK